MSYRITTDRQEAEELRRLANKALNFVPVKGVHVGRGRHRVPMPDTWDGRGPVPPGWTVAVDIETHPRRAEYAVRLPDTGDQLLTQQERDTLQAARAASVPRIPEEWEEREGATAPDVRQR